MSYINYDSIRNEYEKRSINRAQAEFLMKNYISLQQIQQQQYATNNHSSGGAGYQYAYSTQCEDNRRISEEKSENSKKIAEKEEKDKKLDSLIAEYYHKSN